MGVITTWLKQAGAAVLACLVLCLAVVPTVDALLCSSDTPAAERVLDGDPVVAASHDHGGGTHREAGGDACVHGHCHQAATAAARAETQVAQADVSGVDLTPAETGLPPSRAPDSPMEPPRA